MHNVYIYFTVYRHVNLFIREYYIRNMNTSALMPMSSMQIKQTTDLPPHITYEQYLKMLDAVEQKYSARNYGKKTNFYIHRDKLFLVMLWETGGRISDVCDIQTSDFQFDRQVLRLRVKKTKRIIEIPMLPETLLMCSEYIRKYNISHKLFEFKRIQGFYKVREYAKIAQLPDNIHPHMFRHGLAIHLLKHHVPLPIIAARLGHSNIRTTIDNYLVITTELQRQFVTQALRNP